MLFGVSYGTKVALEYAERYPQNVEALVLDSVVPPERADPFSLSTFKAMKPVFEELCSAGACAGITSNPLGDIARLAAGLHTHALSGSSMTAPDTATVSTCPTSTCSNLIRRAT